MELETVTHPARLRRVLTIWDLVFCGIVLIQPIAPVGIFGIAQKISHGLRECWGCLGACRAPPTAHCVLPTPDAPFPSGQERPQGFPYRIL
jgi:hypothetical protein